MGRWGNLWESPSYISYPRLDSANDTLSERFTAQASKTVAQLRLWVNAIVGTSPTYRVGLQSDSSGDPSGSWLGGNCYVDTQLTAGENVFNVTDTAITAGTVYHLVVEYNTGTINTSNYAQMQHSSSLGSRHYFYPYDGKEDLNLGLLWSSDGGSSWDYYSSDDNPAFILDYSDATYAGVPIHNRVNYSLNASNIRIGEKFSPDETMWVTSFGCIIRIASGSPGALKLSLYNDTDSTYVLNEVDVTTAGITGSYAWIEHTFDKVSLDAAKTYKWWIRAPNSDGSNYYQVPANNFWNYCPTYK